MAANLRSRIATLVESFVPENRRDDAFIFLEENFEKNSGAGKSVVSCYSAMLGHALNIVVGHQCERSFSYLMNVTFVPAIRSGDIGVKWYHVYRKYLTAIAVIAFAMFLTGSLLAVWTDDPVLRAIVISISFGLGATGFATGKLAFQYGEFVVLAACFYLLPMASVLSAIPACLAGLACQSSHVGWIVFAVSLSIWMALGLAEFHANWEKRSQS